MNSSAFGPIAAALALAATGFAAAQPAQSVPSATPGHQWVAEGHGEMGRHLQALHEMLAITPPQEAAWQAMVAAVRPPEDAMMREHARMMGEHAAAMRGGGDAMAEHSRAMAAEGAEMGRDAHAMADAALAEHGMGPGMEKLPLPERLERMQQMMQRHEAMMNEHMGRMISATRNLYAVLTPDQRRILDHMPALMGPHMGMMRMGEGPMAMHMHAPPAPPAPPVPPSPPAG
ncbi:MAG TPA: Spy/CpxP family protein refolding chaperone [Caulobacteraceae bacterium]|jgi:hypothetical protein|nr:Spy/CpxP family protein refolding chaperone [Caulobacteraceae bacterium]